MLVLVRMHRGDSVHCRALKVVTHRDHLLQIIKITDYPEQARYTTKMGLVIYALQMISILSYLVRNDSINFYTWNLNSLLNVVSNWEIEFYTLSLLHFYYEKNSISIINVIFIINLSVTVALFYNTQHCPRHATKWLYNSERQCHYLLPTFYKLYFL